MLFDVSNVDLFRIVLIVSSIVEKVIKSTLCEVMLLCVSYY